MATNIDSLNISIRASAKPAIDAIDRLKTSLAGLKAESASIKGAASTISHSFVKSSAPLNDFSKRIKNATKSARSALHSLAGSFKKLFASTSGSKKSIGMIDKLFRSIGRIAFYRAIRSLMRTITQGFKEGIKNLYQYSELVGTKFKSSMDSLATSALYVKNAFAAMSAPLINVLAPIIDRIADKIAGLANKMAEFFAALTGQNVYTRSIKYAQEYNNELSETNKQLDKWLGSFDEINRMNDPNGSGNNDAVDYSKMFEEAVVSSEMSNLAKKIVEAFSNADLSGIGKALGEKIKSALDNLNWEQIKQKAENAAKKITSFLNGALSVEGIGTSIGTTIAEGFNTAITYLYTLVSTFNWGRFGTVIGEAIRAVINTIDIGKAGEGLHNFAMGILAALSNAVKGIGKVNPVTGKTGWQEFGEKIAQGIGNIKFGEIIAGTVSVGWSIVSGILDATISFLEESERNGFWDDLGTGVGKALASIDWGKLIGNIATIGVKILKGIYKSIKSAVAAGFGLDDETAGLIVDTLAVTALTTKIALLIARVVGLTGAFGGKNRMLSNQTSLTAAETSAAYGLGGVYGGLASVAVPALVGALGGLATMFVNLARSTDSAGASVSAATPGISELADAMNALEEATAEGARPISNAMENLIPNSARTMDVELTRYLKTSGQTIEDFGAEAAKSLTGAFNTMTNSVAANLEATAKNEENYMKTEGENWRKYNQSLINNSVTAAQEQQKARNSLNNGTTIFAGAVLGGLAISMLGNLNRGRGGGGQFATSNIYASGGFPSAGSMFIAGEAGPEYVGAINGRTGVWNSDQLVQGLYTAFTAALAANPQGGDIYLDGEVIYRNTVRRNNNLVRSTGRSALLT